MKEVLTLNNVWFSNRSDTGPYYENDLKYRPFDQVNRSNGLYYWFTLEIEQLVESVNNTFWQSGCGTLFTVPTNYGEGHARGIARTFEASVSPVQSQLEKFEVGGVLVSRMVGNSRIYYWNDRNPLIVAVRDLLQKVLGSLPDDELDKYYRERRKPRRAGKSL